MHQLRHPPEWSRNRTLLVVGALLVLVSAVSSACVVSDSASAQLFASTEGCSAGRSCTSALCTCAGQAQPATGSLCVLPPNVACTTGVQSCLTQYVECIVSLSTARSRSTEAACTSLGLNVHTATLYAAAVPADEVVTSTLFLSCQARMCEVVNGSCSLNPDPCAAAMPARVTPPVTEPAVQYAVRAQMKFSGLGFAHILGNATHHAAFVNATIDDLTDYLGLETRNLVNILSVHLDALRPDLVVDFGILDDTRLSVARLYVSVESILYGPTFGARMRSVYHAIPETNGQPLTVLTVYVVSTMSPAPSPPSTPAATTAPALNPANHMLTSTAVTAPVLVALGCWFFL